MGQDPIVDAIAREGRETRAMLARTAVRLDKLRQVSLDNHAEYMKNLGDYHESLIDTVMATGGWLIVTVLTATLAIVLAIITH